MRDSIATTSFPVKDTDLRETYARALVVGQLGRFLCRRKTPRRFHCGVAVVCRIHWSARFVTGAGGPHMGWGASLPTLVTPTAGAISTRPISAPIRNPA